MRPLLRSNSTIIARHSRAEQFPVSAATTTFVIIASLSK
jgi:hypothetical protein